MTDPAAPPSFRHAIQQAQFLDVAGLDEAHARLRANLRLEPVGMETVRLLPARGRVLARDVLAPLDVPGFDRASVDGFAVRAEDVASASNAAPAVLRLNPEVLTPGVRPTCTVAPGTATVIATGGMVPRGADAVVMVEHTDARQEADGTALLEVHRPASPGQLIAAAGSDIARGETVLRRGQVLTSREIGMFAAVGLAEIPVWRRPRVAIFSTGDEIVAPGGAIEPGQVYDSNAAILAAAVEEAGGEPILLGIVPDDPAALAAMLDRALREGDIVLLSGGTSKGAGDIAYQIVARLQKPGVIVHGVALKPGKPLCLAVQENRLVAVLPGFPTSAIFTFHEFVAPVIRALAGQPVARQQDVPAQLPIRIGSERGRTEYVLVSLMHGEDGLIAYPTAKGSGAVTGFAQADGFFTVPALTETVAAGTAVDVRLIGTGLPAADLVIIGSHCVGLDMLVGRLEAEGIRVKSLAVGSMGGLAAAKRGECDIAGIHLMDPDTGQYNVPYVTDTLTLAQGYGRLQGVVFRAGDARFTAHASAAEAVAAVAADPGVLMVNRNAGSGTRIVIDRLLGGAKPAGYAHATKSHNAVAVAVAQDRADWGVAIETVARQYGLGFLPLQAERYDFVLPRARASRPAARRFVALLRSADTRAELAALGFDVV